MALSFEQVGSNGNQEVRFKAPSALVAEFKAGLQGLKDRGIRSSVNDEFVKTLTKINGEIQAYIRDNPIPTQKEDGAVPAPDAGRSGPTTG